MAGLLSQDEINALLNIGDLECSPEQIKEKVLNDEIADFIIEHYSDNFDVLENLEKNINTKIKRLNKKIYKAFELIKRTKIELKEQENNLELFKQLKEKYPEEFI